MKLPEITREKGLILLAGMLIGAWLGLKLFAPKVQNTVTVKEIIRVDTSYVYVDTSFNARATKDTPIKPKTTKAKDPEKDPQPEKYDSVRTYTGTYQFDYGKFDWSIETGGILSAYSFKPTITIPTVTVDKEKVITHTKTIIQKGLFAGGGINSKADFHIGATYLGEKYLIEYNIVPQTVQTYPITLVHQVGFKYKIF